MWIRHSGCWVQKTAYTRLIRAAVCLVVVAALCLAFRDANAAVVINEINYHPDTDEELEEYVEIHNTAGTAVDLSNWQFVQGLTYTFPPGTTLPGYGYLVVARDPVRATALFGVSNIVGPFAAGRLDNNGERITLVNDAGTTVDTVRYDDDWPWPAAADGAGSSLELIDPNDDNDHPRNWRGSTTGTSGFDLFQHEAVTFPHRHTPGGDQTLAQSFRMSGVPIAVDPARTLQTLQLPPTPPSGKIFIFGLTLFDGSAYTYIDLTPYLDTDGISYNTDRTDGNLDGGGATYAAEEISSSGGYTSCQTAGHTQVRWLTPNRADGALNCIHSSAETVDVPDGQYVRAYFLATATNTSTINAFVGVNYSDGTMNQPFEITDWYMGNAIPTRATSRVTPGTQNSVYGANTPPFIREIAHAPVNPTSTDTVTITARVDDADGITDVSLSYSINENSWQTTAMHDDGAHGDGAAGDGVFGATLAAQVSETVVAYRIEATDGAAVPERFPYAAEAEQALAYFVYDGGIATNLPIQWLFISPGDKARLDSNPGSDETVPATFVDSKGRVYYHVQVRYRGAWARSWPKKCWKIIFNKGNEFDGRARINLNSNWNDEILIREHLCYEIFRMAGYPHCETRLIHWRVASGGASAFQGVYVEVEQPNRDYLERNGLDRDGSLYKANDNGVYPPRSNERKLDPTSIYYFVYEKKTLEWIDYTDLIDWTWGLDATPQPNLIDYLDQTTDLWRLTEYVALNAIISNWDHVGKNHYDVRDSVTNKWVQLPWDCDRTLGEYTSPGYRTDQPLDYGREEVAGPGGMYSYLHDRFLEESNLAAFYHRMLRRYCCDFFYAGRMHAVVDRMRTQMGIDAQLDYNLWKGGASYDNEWTFWRTTRDYVQERRDYILNNVSPGSLQVRINEFMTSNTAVYPDEMGEFEDWIELYNPRPTPIDLGGYYLSDRYSTPTRWQIPANTWIQPGERLVIFCDGETGEGPLHANFRLEDEGEQIGLFDIDARGNLPIDWITYGPQVQNVSAGRNGDGGCGWVAYATPGPTQPNVVRSVGPPSVYINEWLASNRLTNADERGEFADWVELYNDGAEPVCIGGRFLTDGLAKHDAWVIPQATIIASKGYLVFWCDGETNEGPLHTNYNLEAQGGEIALYDADTSTLIDSVTFGAQVSDISEGRCPDGSSVLTRFTQPTPGRPNCQAGPSAIRRWRDY